MVNKKFLYFEEGGEKSPPQSIFKSDSKRIVSEETKKKISETLKRKGIQPKIRYSGEVWNKGKSLHYNVWNKGKVGLQHSTKKGKSFEELYGTERAEEIRGKIKDKRAEQIPSEHQKEIVSRIMKGNKYSRLRKSYAISEEHKKKLLKASIGRIKSPEEIKKLKENRAKQIFPKKDSKIEIKIRDFLEELQIEYFQHKHMNIRNSYQCDFFIPSLNLVIECDGVYWHRYPTGRDIDHVRTKELVQKGFKVLRLWEFEINEMSLNEFKEKLK